MMNHYIKVFQFASILGGGYCESKRTSIWDFPSKMNEVFLNRINREFHPKDVNFHVLNRESRFLSLMHAFLPPKRSRRFYPFLHLGWGLRAQEPSLSRLQPVCWRNSRRVSKVHKRHPFFGWKFKRMNCNFRNKKTFWSCFCEQRSSTLPYLWCIFFLLDTNLTELFSSSTFRQCSFWENFLHTQVVEGLGYVPPGFPNNQFISWMFDDFEHHFACNDLVENHPIETTLKTMGCLGTPA